MKGHSQAGPWKWPIYSITSQTHRKHTRNTVKQLACDWLRGALKWDLSKNLVFCPNQVDPHPPPRKLGHPKLKKNWCFFCILGYSKHIIFSWKSHTFGVTDDFLCDFWWFCWLGLGNPCHIATKTPLEKLNQNLGLADPPPLSWDKRPNFSNDSIWRLPLSDAFNFLEQLRCGVICIVCTVVVITFSKADAERLRLIKRELRLTSDYYKSD